MKLLFCKNCCDVFNLKYRKITKCECGKSAGAYIDDLYAQYSGKDAILFAIDNYSFFARVRNDEKQEFYDQMHGKDNVQCWVMNKDSLNYRTIRKVPFVVLKKNLDRTKIKKARLIEPEQWERLKTGSIIISPAGKRREVLDVGVNTIVLEKLNKGGRCHPNLTYYCYNDLCRKYKIEKY